MDYAVFLHPKADKSLRKLEAGVQERIKDKVRELRESWQKGERLKNSRFYKIRAGDYRIIYEIWHDEKKIIVLFIGHRSKVYDDFGKLL